MSTAELQETVFFILATVIVVCSILTVTTNRILRSATYLLFVLFATAGIYFQLEYSFLGAVQLTIYAGGIIILYVFSILLTTICVYITLMHSFGPSRFVGGEINQKVIGTALMGTEKYQYLLPFEVISVLLLTCIIGGIMIARKR